jgi:glucose-6-phosphate 1-dehydrogenase
MTGQSTSAPPCVLVIFGAAGDLTHRLLLPALFNLRAARLLPDNFAIVGIARAAKDDNAFRAELAGALRMYGDAGTSASRSDVDWLAQRMFYLRGDFDDQSTYGKLAQVLAKTDQIQSTGGNYLFYLATPPQEFAAIPRRLSQAGLLRETDGHWRRVIIEKPFGADLRSAQELNSKLLSVLAESQIYRIDHYLGKETVQNILVLRFANGLFEPLWNRHHIDHVQITVAETVTVEQRGKFYDATGALRDMVPNHLFQLLTLIAMEPPTCFDAEAVRSEKAKVLEAAHAFGRQDARHNVVRAQYGAGNVEGRTVAPYRQAPGVSPTSITETYVALKLVIDNWRWAGVPFYVRTGKALAARRSEVVIQFKQAPFALFRDTPVERLAPNDMRIQIQPEEGITLGFSAKIPGPSVRMDGVAMKFNYRDHFRAAANTGYETLIYDCMLGDPTLFQRADNIEAGWRVVQPILDAWAEDHLAHIAVYPAGSPGPPEADTLLEGDHRHWRAIRGEHDER